MNKRNSNKTLKKEEEDAWLHNWDSKLKCRKNKKIGCKWVTGWVEKQAEKMGFYLYIKKIEGKCKQREIQLIKQRVLKQEQCQSKIW